MKHIFTALMVCSVVDISIIDSDGDRSKAVIVVHHASGNTHFVVPKDKIDDRATLDAIVEWRSRGCQEDSKR